MYAFLKDHWQAIILIVIMLGYFIGWALSAMAKKRDNALNESYWRKLNELQGLFRNSDRYPSDDMKRPSVKKEGR